MTYPKLVSWKYNPGNDFLAFKKLKEEIRLYYVKDLEAEKALEKSKVILTEPFGHSAPGIFVEEIEGFASEAKNHGELLTKYRNKYPELENKYEVKRPSAGDVFGKYIYSNLPHLNHWVYPLTDKYPDYIIKEKYILLSAFEDENFLEDLVNYRPRFSHGGEITEYQTKYLPNFLKALKYKKSEEELYSTFLKYKKVQDLDKDLNPIGKKVKVKTLNPGEVKLLLEPVLETEKTIWNGKEIEILLKQDNPYNINKLSFTPEDNYIVEVVEESAVIETTEFL